MSVAVDCPPCMLGDHERHDPGHGLIPGLLGGMSCHCQGDCAERREAADQEFLRHWYLDYPIFAPDQQGSEGGA